MTAAAGPAARGGHLVGPVFSRRIGRSLGVDLLKGECTFLCPYCEVRVRHVDEIALFPFAGVSSLLEEYKSFCVGRRAGDIDSVTFSGTGEPTLISNLGEILREFKKIGPFPLTVITNGSLLWMPAVRRNLAAADRVIPSLDAVTPSAWKRVNRPHPGISLEKYLGGTKDFCAQYRGQLWLEILLVRNVNDAPEDIDALGRFLKDVRADVVQVGTVDRPPARTRVKPVPDARLKAAARRIANLSGHKVDAVLREKISASPPPAKSAQAGVARDDWQAKILASVRLRPQTPAELRRFLAAPKSVFDDAVRGLEAAGKISRVRFNRRGFLQAAPIFVAPQFRGLVQ